MPGIGDWITGVLQRDGAKVATVIPEEGGLQWTESLSIGKGSRRQDLARELIQYMLSPEGQVRTATMRAYPAHGADTAGWARLNAEQPGEAAAPAHGARTARATLDEHPRRPHPAARTAGRARALEDWNEALVATTRTCGLTPSSTPPRGGPAKRFGGSIHNDASEQADARLGRATADRLFSPAGRRQPRCWLGSSSSRRSRCWSRCRFWRCGTSASEPDFALDAWERDARRAISSGTASSAPSSSRRRAAMLDARARFPAAYAIAFVLRPRRERPCSAC